jgi:hypothetical protein
MVYLFFAIDHSVLFGINYIVCACIFGIKFCFPVGLVVPDWHFYGVHSRSTWTLTCSELLFTA